MLRVFNKIVAAIDNSDFSDIVRSWSEGLGKAMNSQVDYITVFPVIPRIYEPIAGWNKELENNLNEAKKNLFSSLSKNLSGEGFKIHELEGKPDKTIIEFGNKNGATLTIVGFKGEGKSRVPVGSTALNIARESDSNVLLVNNRFKKPIRIAISEDLEHKNKGALLLAFALAKFFGSTLYRIHVIDKHFINHAPRDLIEELKFEIILELSKSVPGVAVQPVILEGDPSFELAYWSTKNDIDIMVFLGTKGRLGLVVEEFLLQTPTNVLICRGL